MFTLKYGRGGGIYFLNETSACVYAIDISLLTAYKYMYMYVHYRRENTFTSMKTPVRLESHRAQKETFFFLSPSFGFEDFLRIISKLVRLPVSMIYQMSS